MSIRLVRFLAQCGVASRRNSADLIRDGKVQVNGETVDSFSLKIDPDNDDVRVRGKQMAAPSEHLYILLNKPAGLVCSHADPHNPETIYELLPRKWNKRLRFVGRLDKNTTGLLILTDDGRLANQLAHPRYEVDKRYITRVEGRVSPETLKHLQNGVELDDGQTWPAQARILKRSETDTRLEITIHEGRKRIVRRMCEALGHPVLTLDRTAYGPIQLNSLRRGKWRELNQDEIQSLKNA